MCQVCSRPASWAYAWAERMIACMRVCALQHVAVVDQGYKWKAGREVERMEEWGFGRVVMVKRLKGTAVGKEGACRCMKAGTQPHARRGRGRAGPGGMYVGARPEATCMQHTAQQQRDPSPTPVQHSVGVLACHPCPALTHHRSIT